MRRAAKEILSVPPKLLSLRRSAFSFFIAKNVCSSGVVHLVPRLFYILFLFLGFASNLRNSTSPRGKERIRHMGMKGGIEEIMYHRISIRVLLLQTGAPSAPLGHLPCLFPQNRFVLSNLGNKQYMWLMFFSRISFFKMLLNLIH